MFRTPIWTLMLLAVFSVGVVTAQDYETDETEEVDARVARVSVLDGKAKIQRIDNEEWEEVVENLPIVEGDIIETDRDTRMEIQLDRFSFLRLDENSQLKFTFLADDGIALSLSRGTLGVALIRFENDNTYLEIDAPESTIAIKKAGSYRIDAGNELDKEVRVSVSDSGEARVYSKDSGFALRDGKTALLFLDGNREGEWETSRNSAPDDLFADWTDERNRYLAAAFTNNDYDQYVDQDVYGADDLDDYGDWTYISGYGNVWSPSYRTIARYRNWSPYRYGQWRWLPYYGWTWVNAEPWGWATYHSGRWIHHRGRWYWSPHRRYRRHRSWWRPAIVFVTYIGNNFCWYPLPYGYDYYDYNRRYRNRWNRRRRNRNRDRNRNTRRNTTPRANVVRGKSITTPPLNRVPRTGIVTVRGGQFGSKHRTFGTPTLTVARKVLGKRPVIVHTPPLIPDRGATAKSRSTKRTPVGTKTGVVNRKTIGPVDERLRKEKMYGNRTPIQRRTTTRSTGTGAFERKRGSKSTTGSGPVYSPPIRSTNRSSKPTRRTTRSTPPVRSTKPLTRTKSPPAKRSTPKRTYPSRQKSTAPRRSSPPARKSSPPARRKSPPARRSSPPRRKSSPPARRSSPKRSAPKRSAPKKSSPKPSKSKKNQLN